MGGRQKGRRMCNDGTNEWFRAVPALSTTYPLLLMHKCARARESSVWMYSCHIPIRIMAATFFFRREKKLRARLRFRFEFHSGLGRFRREGGQVWGGSPSEKCPYCGGEIDRGSRGDEVGVEVWYPVGMTAVSFHWVIRFYTCYVFLMKFPCVF